MMITCPTDQLDHEWFEEIQPHNSPTLGSHSVSLARKIPKFPRPTQQLHEANVSPLTIKPEGKENYSASDSPSNAHVSPSDVDLCTSESKKSPNTVHGSSPSHVSSSFRSQFSPFLGQVRTPAKPSPPKKRVGVFTLGGSSGDDGSSFIERMTVRSPRGDATDTGLARPETMMMSEMGWSSDQVSLRTRHAKNQCSSDKEIIESDNEGSMSAFDDDDDIKWEDSDFESDGSIDDEHRHLFQRVDSRPNLVSRQSMLTMMINNPERMQGNTFSSSSVSGVSCTKPAKNLSISTLPLVNDQEISTMDRPNVPWSKPVIMKSSPSPSPSVAHSPCTVRRKLLATELSDSDRRDLLWERQQNDPLINAFLKRRGTVHDMKFLQEHPEPNNPQERIPSTQPGDCKNSNASSQANDIDNQNDGLWTSYATDYGPWEYHAKGW